MNLSAPVLIIDDDPTTTEVVKEILESAGHTTATALNAFHGLKLAREVKPAVIVCDMVMPHMAGSDVFRELAADPATAGIPRVLMTGHSNADRSGSDGFLLKPIQPHVILELLERMVSKRRVPHKPAASKEAQWHG